MFCVVQRRQISAMPEEILKQNRQKRRKRNCGRTCASRIGAVRLHFISTAANDHRNLYKIRPDHRTRRDRIRLLFDGFQPQMEAIATAYMAWDVNSFRNGLGTLFEVPDDAMVQNTLNLLVVDLFCRSITSTRFSTNYSTSSLDCGRSVTCRRRVHRIWPGPTRPVPLLPNGAQRRNHDASVGGFSAAASAVPPLHNAGICSLIMRHSRGMSARLCDSLFVLTHRDVGAPSTISHYSVFSSLRRLPRYSSHRKSTCPNRSAPKYSELEASKCMPGLYV